MHRNSAGGLELRLAYQISLTADLVPNAHRRRLPAVVQKLRRVVQNQYRFAPVSYALSRRGKVTRQNRTLVDSRIGKKSIRRLRVGPVLTRPRNAAADAARELSGKSLEPFA
jgi:hypothetical protein